MLPDTLHECLQPGVHGSKAARRRRRRRSSCWGFSGWLAILDCAGQALLLRRAAFPQQRHNI